jgi:hypothetical protein
MVEEDQVAALLAAQAQVLVPQRFQDVAVADGLMGYLDSQSGAVDDATLRRAMAYGSTLASFWVEQFGCERAESLTREEIDARYEQFKRITSIDAVASPRPTG